MSDAEENERPIQVNWLAVWLTIFFLIVIGWCLGLLLHPPVAEILYCESHEVVETMDTPDGGLSVICMDYTE